MNRILKPLAIAATLIATLAPAKAGTPCEASDLNKTKAERRVPMF